MRSPHVVYKFGGTSVGTAKRFRAVIDILRRTSQVGEVVAIVSAQGTVTRRLSSGMDAFADRPEDRSTILEELIRDLHARHLSQAEAVLSPERRDTYVRRMEERLRTLRTIFSQVERDRFPDALRDAVLATGEQLSVPMVTLALRDAGCRAPYCDATALVVTDDTFGNAAVDMDATRKRVRNWYATLSQEDVPVVAGFIGSTPDGRTSTLGFEGSDYSAALFARFLGAECLTRYTDVDGLYTDDPRTREAAERFESLSMEEALARTESGSLGMHPKTLRPLADAGIPMQVRSIDTPDGRGTRIVPDAAENVRVTPPVGEAAPAALHKRGCN